MIAANLSAADETDDDNFNDILFKKAILLY